jgi:hypothetical protein
LNTKDLLVCVGLVLVLVGVAAFFAWLTATGLVAFVGLLDLVEVFAPCLFAETGDLGFGLEVRTFAAFLARAFPAGERLVAGFRRVDLPAITRLRDDDRPVEWRDEERAASFFTLLAMGLLMRKALDSLTIHQKDRRKKQGGA